MKSKEQREFWNLVGTDVVKAIDHFFSSGRFLTGCNSFFITLIPKVVDAKLVNDFRLISLIGCFYKIINKILANRLSLVIDDLVSKEQPTFIKGRQILDGPFIFNEMISWCKIHKQQALRLKIDFEKAYDCVRWDFLDDILACFHFGVKWRSWIKGCFSSCMGSILVNGSPTCEFQFQRAWAVFSDLYSLMGVSVPIGDVETVASVVGCKASKLPVTYLGVKVGENMMRSKAWSDVISKVSIRLSKWKVKTLSARGRLTLLKSVLGSIPTYYMSLYKAPQVVINSLESLRYKFLAKFDEKKLTWVAWKKVLSCKESGGLGVNSLLALNHALLFKWIWIFRNDPHALWVRVVKSRHGADGLLSSSVNRLRRSSSQDAFPKSVCFGAKHIDISGSKKEQRSSVISFHRAPRGGIEATQWEEINQIIDSMCLTSMEDRWIWSMNGSGLFSVASTRIDKLLLSLGGDSTKWCKLLPIKVNIMVWKLSLDRLPTRLNLSSSGINIPTLHCPICEDHLESRDHLLFSCTFVNNVIDRFADGGKFKFLICRHFNSGWIGLVLFIK
ncbi:RNA-directed DNA polymerase, eukaryota [Tanacetum coccineum]